MQASEFFLKTAFKLGISNVFGILGAEAQAIRFNEEKNISFYLTRHEFTAGIMADVYGRLTGKPQICYSTFGPGLTNMSTGVCSAILDRSPVIFVSAQIPRDEVYFNQTHQCIDNVSFMKVLTKNSVEISNIFDIPKILEISIKKSINEIPGPSYISFPLDLMKQEIENRNAEKLLDNILPITKEPAHNPNFNKLKDILKVLKKSKYPIIIVGNQVIREDCCKEVFNLSKKK